MENDIDNDDSGYGLVYVTTNETQPGLVKVGMTTRSAGERENELSSHTGVAGRHVIVYAALCYDPMQVEHETHEALSAFRLQTDREFFRVDIAQAIQEIEKIAGTRFIKRHKIHPGYLDRTRSEAGLVEGGADQRRKLVEQEQKRVLNSERLRMASAELERNELKNSLASVGDAQAASSLADLEEFIKRISEVQERPENHLAWNRLGLWYSDHKRYSDAIDLFRQAISIRQDSPMIWRSLAESQHHTGSRAEAIDSFRTSLELDSGSARSWDGLGTCLYQLDRFGESVDAFHEAIRLKPEEAGYWFNLAESYEKLKANDKSQVAYRKSVELLRQASNADSKNEDVLAKILWWRSNLGRMSWREHEEFWTSLPTSSSQRQMLVNECIYFGWFDEILGLFRAWPMRDPARAAEIERIKQLAVEDPDTFSCDGEFLKKFMDQLSRVALGEEPAEEWWR